MERSTLEAALRGADAADGERHCEDGSRKARRVYKFQPIVSEHFASRNYRPEWLVPRLLVRKEPCVVGGPKKTLKTSVMLDMAISLGSGTPFLGQFPVYQSQRVAVLSGESGPHTLQETALRICESKGIELATVNCLWDFRLPRLATEDVAELQNGLQEHQIDVVIIDPLYLCLLAGQSFGLQASNIFDMGHLLSSVAGACLEINCTLILIHHFRMSRSEPYAEPQLEDLAYAGIQEFARQWILLGRRERYEGGTGFHKLWLSVGGSAGHGGCWAVDINEGTLDDQFGGRKWQVTLTLAREAMQQEAESQDTIRSQKQEQKDRNDETKLLVKLDELDREGKGITYTKLRDNIPLPNARMERAVTRLTREPGAVLEEFSGLTDIGSGAKRSARIIRRKRTNVNHQDNHRDHRLY
jgi:replicative DNA helicase